MLDGSAYTVVGVVPAGDQPFKEFDLYVPLGLSPAQMSDRSDRRLRPIGRLKRSVRLEQAQAEMSNLARRLEQQYPHENEGAGIRLIPLKEMLVGDVRPALLVVLGAVGLVLLIACANVANLLLARAEGRRREIALRRAVGANRGRLVRQLLTESGVLGMLGAVTGLAVAYFGTPVLSAVAPAAAGSTALIRLPGMDQIGMDARVLGFALGLTLIATLSFGLVPALGSSSPNLTESLKEGGRGSVTGFGGRRLRNLLVVSELALALVLLIGAALMVKSFARVQQTSLGFDPRNVLTVSVTLPDAKYSKPAQKIAFYSEVFRRIQTLSEVRSAAGVDFLPLSGHWGIARFTLEGRLAASPGDYLLADRHVISPSYFETMGIPLVEGRSFTDHDREGQQAVTIINETMARRYWPGEDPVGKRINMGPQDRPEWRQIVGVARDVRHFGLDAEPHPEIYKPYSQSPESWMTFVVRTASDPRALAKSLRDEVLAVDGAQPVYDIQTMDELVTQCEGVRRFSMLLISVYAGIAMLLAAVGIYGVMSYSVAQRTRELGVRMGLGASAQDVLGLVMGQGMKLALIGAAAGLAAAFGLTRLMSSLLFGVSATDTVTFLLVPVVLCIVALVSTYLPARRATRIDPMEALRCE